LPALLLILFRKICRKELTLKILVQKFGGTSVGDTERIKNVARRAIEEKKRGYSVVVTVSAMAGETDRLLSLAKEISPRPNERELDMMVSTGEQVSVALLAMALHSMGYKAISMNAAQAGIYTDSSHTRAKIEKIHAHKITEELEKDNIVIVAGFQGINEDASITTLGRGGSDTTAVALAAALEAEKCEIYTDVDGVYTADPRIVPEARKLHYITHDEMLELSSLGAKVLHSRSVEFAKKYNVPLEVKSSFKDEPGTIIGKEYEGMEKFVVTGITCKKDEAKVNLVGLPDTPGIAGKVFEKLAEKSFNINMITQTSLETGSGLNNISFTFPYADFATVKEVTEEIKETLKPQMVVISDNIAIVTLVGVGMKSNPGVAARMFSSLGKAGINIQMIATSEIKISVAVDVKEADQAVKILHKEFELDKEVE
jgi:aspartate kinase